MSRGGGGSGGAGGGVPHFMGNIFGRRRAAAANAQPHPASNHDSSNLVNDFVDGVVDAASEAFRSFPSPPSHTSTDTGTIPPASPTVLQQLPQIRVRPHDLLDPANRECCICLDEIVVGTQVTRLPSCAHLFHTDCCRRWLRRQCTCPTCRYEFPTLDAAYEPGRVARMRLRKPRYAEHELRALTIAELKQLTNTTTSNTNTTLPAHIKDKASLIDYVIQQDCIDLIPGAEEDFPAYQISALQQMSVRELKHVMNEGAGVFFDPKEVLEKQDMIHIFVASGRLQVVPEDDDDDDDKDDAAIDRDNPNAPAVVREGEEWLHSTTTVEDRNGMRNKDQKSAEVTVETVDSDTEEKDSEHENDDTTNSRDHTDLVMEENLAYREVKRQSQPRSARQTAKVTLTEPQNPVAPSVVAEQPATAPTPSEAIPTAESTSESASAQPRAPTDAASNESIPLVSFQNLSISQAQAMAHRQGIDISDLVAERTRLDCLLAERLGWAGRNSSSSNTSSSGSSAAKTSSSTPTTQSGEDEERKDECCGHRRRKRHRPRREEEDQHSLSSDDSHHHQTFEAVATAEIEAADAVSTMALRIFLQGRTVAQLRAIAAEKSVDFAGVLEKCEMLDRLIVSWASPSVATAHGPSRV